MSETTTIHWATDEKLAQLQAEILGLKAKVERLEGAAPGDKVSIVVSSNDFDRLFPAFIIATGAASFGMEVSMFFTLWGLHALKTRTIYKGKTPLEKMFSAMMPKRPENGPLSKMNYWGLGPKLMKRMMKRHNVETLPNLMALAEELGVEMTACQMTMGLMGITEAEMRPGIQYGGVAKFIADASESKFTLFL
ncbi:MAG: DsrE/DsrF/DrsH-like family protein [Bacteroidia bacterium]|nr:DsrE/DsrF/DrsH-like family protein [Bacteroidia bacterium]MDW8332877.1 DsrE/DsrF/DrsH-like family protein [Bacteroidia bacterium]